LCCCRWLSESSPAIPPRPSYTPTPGAAASAVAGSWVRVGARNGAGHACQDADQRRAEGSRSRVGHGSCPGLSSSVRRPDTGIGRQNRVRVDWGRPTRIAPFIMKSQPVASWLPVGGGVPADQSGRYPWSSSSWLVPGAEKGMVRVAVRPRTLQPWPGFTVMPSGTATSSVNLAGLARGCGSAAIS
jgi:hypothetical protein